MLPSEQVMYDVFECLRHVCVKLSISWFWVHIGVCMYQLLSLHVFVSNQTCRKLCINFSSPTNQTRPRQGEESLIGEFGGGKKKS